ncbi:MAG: hypothetical protein AB1489_26450 [Acidobacteriota bacterium]
MDKQMRLLIGYDGSESSNAMFDDLRRAGLPVLIALLLHPVIWLQSSMADIPAHHQDKLSSL